MLGGSILLVLLTLIALYILHKLLKFWQFIEKAKKLPSTKCAPLIGHIPNLWVPRNRLLDEMVKMIDEHPKFYTLWVGPMPVVAVVSPHLLEIILGSQKHIDKPLHYTFLESWLGTGLLTSTGSKWRSHRKMLTPAFHFSILENFIEVFVEKSQILVKKLEKELESEDIDVFPFVSRCTLDVICDTAMGVSINAQDTEQKSEYIEAVCDSTNTIMERFIAPWLYPSFIYNLTPSGRRMQRNLKILHDFSRKVIRERKALFYSKTSNSSSLDETAIEGRKKRLAFLDLLLEASENGTKLTDEEIREEVDTFMFEGHDTTAAAISFTLLQLGQNPEIQETVYKELESIFQGSDRPPTSKDLSEMKYLERVIKEGLRRYPSVPFIGRILKEDIEFDGYTIPAGMIVMLIPIATQYFPEYYEVNDGFDPDNFLPENIAKRHPYSYLPFSAGPRNCIGQKFAMLEMKTAISSIIRNFKFVPVGEEPEPLPNLIMRPEIGIHLKLTKRVTSI